MSCRIFVTFSRNFCCVIHIKYVDTMWILRICFSSGTKWND